MQEAEDVVAFDTELFAAQWKETLLLFLVQSPSSFGPVTVINKAICFTHFGYIHTF